MIDVVDGATDTLAFARISSEVMRWWTVMPETVEHERATMPTYGDWIALLDGEAVGTAVCVEPPDMKESTAAAGAVQVLPRARRRGIGTALYELVSTHARSLGKTELEVFAFADDPDGVAYAERRGFGCVMRVRALRLALAGCGRLSVDIPDGITLTTLAERPDLAHALWEVACDVMPDIPYDGDSPFHPGTFDEFRELELAGPQHIAEATFIALDGSELAGYGKLTWLDRPRGIAQHSMLAVRRTHRGRGIATALKAAQIAWALDHGLTELRTGNEERNTAARAVNAKFPYESTPDGLLLRGPLPPTR